MWRTFAGVTVIALLTTGCGGSKDAARVTQAASSKDAGAAPVQPQTSAAPAAAGDPVALAAAPAAKADAPADASAGAMQSGSTKRPGGKQAGTDKQSGIGKQSGAGTTTQSSGQQTGIAGLMKQQAIFGGTQACKPATGSAIPIGNVSTLSGLLGEQFAPVQPALKMFIQSQNACGGIAGHPIDFHIADGQDDPATSVTVAGRMIEQYHVVAFMGNIMPFTIDAFAKFANSKGVPVIGGDLTTNVWFTDPYVFPEGAPPQAEGAGWAQQAKALGLHKVGIVYCIEVPQACTVIDKSFTESAQKLGLQVVYNGQGSFTQPDFTPQCLAAKQSGAEAFVPVLDAPGANRFARDCKKVGYTPQFMIYALGVGNEKQFFGVAELGNAYVPLNSFPWMAGAGAFPGNPAMQYWQKIVTRYNPGFASGGAASLGWQSGALLVAAATASPSISPSKPVTTANLLDGLWQFRGQDWTTLGGLAPPLAFGKDKTPTVPYCTFAATSNANNTAWAKVDTAIKCSDFRVPSDPQATAKNPALPK
jgi:branched-chain amino acid transport system substrate-binding protein